MQFGNETIHYYFSRSSVSSTPVRGLPGMSPTSTPSPKKRQLPAIPVEAQRAGRDRGEYHYPVYLGHQSWSLCMRKPTIWVSD